MSFVKRSISVIRASFDSFNSGFGWSLASHVALSMMLALFPFCIFVVSVAAQLSADVEIETIVEFVFGTWPEVVAEPIVRELLAVLENSTLTTTTFGALAALFFASNGVDAVRVAISHAYGEDAPQPLWRTRLKCLVFVLSGAAVLSVAALLAVGVPIYGAVVAEASPVFDWRLRWSDAVRSGLTLLLLLFVVYAAHAWLPYKWRSARQLWPGVALTLVLWFVTGWIFAAYFRSFGTYGVTYAGLAGAMAALVFLYLMAAIFIFCAEFNGALMQVRKERTGRAGQPAGAADEGGRAPGE